MQLYMYYRFLASSSSETTRTAQWCHQVASMVHAIVSLSSQASPSAVSHAILGQMKSVIPGASPEQQRQWRDELRQVSSLVPSFSTIAEYRAFQVAQRCIETAGFTRERKQKAVFGVEEVRHMVDVAISQNAYFLNVSTAIDITHFCAHCRAPLQILQHIAIWVLVLLLGLRPGSIVRTKNEEDHYLRWGVRPYHSFPLFALH